MEILVGKIDGTKNVGIIKERDNLIKIIRNNGFSCHEFFPNSNILNYQNLLRNGRNKYNFSNYLSNIYFWPRDLFFYKNKKIIINDPSISHHMGEGGYSVNSNIDDSKLFLSEYLFDKYSNNHINTLQGVNIFKINSGRKYGGKKLKHIDLTCFYSGEHETLFVDKNFYSNNSIKCFERIKNQGINVVFFQEEKHISYNYFPANCLSVSKNNVNETVFINQSAVGLKKVLKNYGIDLVNVNICKNTRFQGSIRCMSNVFVSTKPKAFINRLNSIILNNFKKIYDTDLSLRVH
jgi:hypothetical protein